MILNRHERSRLIRTRRYVGKKRMRGRRISHNQSSLEAIPVSKLLHIFDGERITTTLRANWSAPEGMRIRVVDKRQIRIPLLHIIPDNAGLRYAVCLKSAKCKKIPSKDWCSMQEKWERQKVQIHVRSIALHINRSSSLELSSVQMYTISYRKA